MSKCLKCTTCSILANDLFTLHCLHLICKICLKTTKMKENVEAGEKNGDILFCPTCEYETFVKLLDFSKLKLPHIIKFLLGLEMGLPTPVCVACKSRGFTTESILWCFECLDFFCQECLDFHSSLPQLDEHSTYTIEEVKNNPDLFTKATELCDDHNKKLTKICTEKGLACCDSCISSDHIDVCRGEHPDAREEFATVYEFPILSQLKKSLVKLQQELLTRDSEISDVEKDIKVFFTDEHKKAEETCKAITNIMLAKADRLVAESQQKTLCKKQETEWRLIKLNQRKSVLENEAKICFLSLDSPDKVPETTLEKVKHTLKDAKKVLSENGDGFIPTLSVSFDSSTERLLNADMFGKITEYQSFPEPQNSNSNPAYELMGVRDISELRRSALPEKNWWTSLLNVCSSDMAGASSSEVKAIEFGGKMFTLSNSIDVHDSYTHVTGCDWKSGNEIVIVDQKVRGKPEICVFNIHNGNLIFYFSLDQKPYDIAVLRNNNCAVTFPRDEEIKIYRLNDGFLQASVNVGFKCHGVCYCPESSVLIVAGEDSIAMYDGNLPEIKCLTVEGEDIRYIHAYNDNLLFYSDLEGNTVYSAIGNGENRFEYTDDDMRGTAGLILDEFKNVYVCEKGSTCINVLSKSGKFLRTFEVGLNPTTISLSKNKRKICIVRGGRNNDNYADIYVSKK